jgi:hypothetical protein
MVIDTKIKFLCRLRCKPIYATNSNLIGGHFEI